MTRPMLMASLLCTLATPLAAQPPTLGDTRWRMVEAPSGVDAHVVFDAKGALSGSGGCNRLVGGYIARDDGAFLASRIATTMMLCPPDAMETERRVLSALEAARVWRIDAGGLSLLDDGGAVLASFAPMP